MTNLSIQCMTLCSWEVLMERSFLAQKEKVFVGWDSSETGHISSFVPLHQGPRTSSWKQFHPQLSTLGIGLERLQNASSIAKSQ